MWRREEECTGGPGDGIQSTEKMKSLNKPWGGNGGEGGEEGGRERERKSKKRKKKRKKLEQDP